MNNTIYLAPFEHEGELGAGAPWFQNYISDKGNKKARAVNEISSCVVCVFFSFAVSIA